MENLKNIGKKIKKSAIIGGFGVLGVMGISKNVEAQNISQKHQQNQETTTNENIENIDGVQILKDFKKESFESGRTIKMLKDFFKNPEGFKKIDYSSTSPDLGIVFIDNVQELSIILENVQFEIFGLDDKNQKVDIGEKEKINYFIRLAEMNSKRVEFYSYQGCDLDKDGNVVKMYISFPAHHPEHFNPNYKK